MSLEMKYFVLKPKAKTRNDHFATASQAAMYIYADIIEEHDIDLAVDLRVWAGREAAGQTRMKYEIEKVMGGGLV